MRSVTTVAQGLVRLTGLISIVLGVLFWTGHALVLIPAHMVIGFVLVLSLWALALLARQAGAGAGFVVPAALLLGFLVVALGVAQDRLLAGEAHWVVRVLHLLLGLGAIGQAEWLAARIKRAGIPTVPQNGS